MDAFPDLATLSDEGLKSLIEELERDENAVSYERRMLQGRIDILRATGGGDVDVDALSAILTGKQKPAPEFSAEAQAQIEELQRQEHEISYKRRMLHGRIDILRAELVARLQRSHGETVLSQLDVAKLSEILAGKSAPEATE
jgi:hypothetical protein